MQEEPEEISTAINGLNRSFLFLVYSSAFIALCFFKNLSFIEPQKYLIGGLFLLFFLHTFLYNLADHRNDTHWAFLFMFFSVLSAIVTTLTNAVAYAVVWGYKYFELSEPVHWYVEIFSSNWPN